MCPKELSYTPHFGDCCLEGLVSSVKEVARQNLEPFAHSVLALKLFILA